MKWHVVFLSHILYNTFTKNLYRECKSFIVKVLVFEIPHGNPANANKRPGAFSQMEKNLSEWSEAGWRIASTNIDNTINSVNYVVFLEK